MFNIFKAVGRDRSSICGRKMDSSPTRASDDTGRRTKKKGQCAKCGATETKWHSPVPTTEWAKDWGRLVLSLCHAKQKRETLTRKARRTSTQTVHVQCAEGPTYLFGRPPRYTCRVGKREIRTSISESKGIGETVGTAVAASRSRLTSQFPTKSGDMCDTGTRS